MVLSQYAKGALMFAATLRLIFCATKSKSEPIVIDFRRASQPSSMRPFAAAYARRGVAHLTVPVDVLTAKADGSVASVATLKPSPEISASEDDWPAASTKPATS